LTAKEYLQRLRRLDTVINQKIKEQGDLRTMSTSIGSFDYAKDRVQTSPSKDAPYERMIDRMTDLEEEINREIDTFVDEKHKIINQIQGLQNADEISVLHSRYVEFKTFEQIAVDLQYTIRNVYFIHGHALQHFENLYLK